MIWIMARRRLSMANLPVDGAWGMGSFTHNCITIIFFTCNENAVFFSEWKKKRHELYLLWYIWIAITHSILKVKLRVDELQAISLRLPPPLPILRSVVLSNQFVSAMCMCSRFFFAAGAEYLEGHHRAVYPFW